MIKFLFLSVDFDEQTADDWDVDMSVYYEKGTNKRLKSHKEFYFSIYL